MQFKPYKNYSPAQHKYSQLHRNYCQVPDERISVPSTANVVLAKVLTIENSATSENSQYCFISQERCGFLSPETGVREVKDQLPCNHTVDSVVNPPLLSSIIIHTNADTDIASQLGS